MRAWPVLLVLVALLLAGCYGPTSTFDAYLRAAAGGEPDRGWHYLADGAYGGDEAAYLRDAAAADWSRFRWSNATIFSETDGFFAVQVDLQSPADSVPDFLIAAHILNGICRDGQPVGLGAWYNGQPQNGLTPSKLSGEQTECNGRFIGDAAFKE
jgi:hypothetical protein